MTKDNRHSWQLTRRETAKRIYIFVFCWVVPARLEERSPLLSVCLSVCVCVCVCVCVFVCVCVTSQKELSVYW